MNNFAKLLVILELVFKAFYKLFVVGLSFLSKNLGWAIVIILIAILVALPKKDRTETGNDAVVVEASVGVGEFAPITKEREGEIATYLEKARATIERARSFFTQFKMDVAEILDAEDHDYAYWFGFTKDNKYNEAFHKALKEYGSLIETEVGRYPESGITKELVAAMIAGESKCNPNAVGKSGELGLMQIMKITAEHYGYKNHEDLKDPAINIYVGVMHLAKMRESFSSLSEALIAYNRGETGAKNKFAENPDKSPSTYEYVEKVAAILEVSGNSNKILL